MEVQKCPPKQLNGAPSRVVKNRSPMKSPPIPYCDVVYTHHQAAAHAIMVITGSSSSCQMYMTRTSILLPPKGVSTTGSKFQSLLKDVLRTLFPGDGRQILWREVNDDPQSGEGEQRFDHVVLQVLRHLLHAIQKPGPGHTLVFQIRQ